MLRFTRHARNRMRLFRIREEEVTRTWTDPDASSREGHLVRRIRRFPGRFGGKPLLIVVDPTGNAPSVVTAYPLKHGWAGR